MSTMAFVAGVALARRSAPTLSSVNSSHFLGTARAGRPAVVASRRVVTPVMKSDSRDGKGADMERLKQGKPANVEDFKAEISPKAFWSNIGFTPYAERQVGRSAMLGFFIGLLIETINPSHPTILSQAERLLNVPANLHALQIILTPGAVPPV